MNKIILASHGGMSAGIRDTVSMIIGDIPNIHVVSTTRDESEDILTQTRHLLHGFESSDKVYILTDIMGGSVNNNMLTLLGEHPDLTIICGMNLSLVLTLALANEPVNSQELEELILQAREQMVNCTKLLEHAAVFEGEDDL